MAATTVVTAMPASSNNPANDIVQRSPGVDECIGWGAPSPDSRPEENKRQNMQLLNSICLLLTAMSVMVMAVPDPAPVPPPDVLSSRLGRTGRLPDPTDTP
ncbi:hypothetical protein FQN51_006530 [Onygenales sp. PD_10]|nr:hypothetical protein FQN51_006530 [Onygenales sp. PD_10]